MRCRTPLLAVAILSLSSPLAYSSVPPVRDVPQGDASILVSQERFERDQREVIEFRALLVALDETLRRNDTEQYTLLNLRLRGMMERELEQARGSVRLFRRAPAGPATEPMTASSFGEGPLSAPATPRDARAAGKAAERRAKEMAKIVNRMSELNMDLSVASDRDIVRTAAFLDQFLGLLREDLSATQLEIREDARAADAAARDR